VRFEPLPPPTQAEVERLLRGVRHRVLRLLEKRGALPAQGPEDALQVYQAHSLQQRLRWTEVDVRPPPSKQPRCAFLEGFSLHANTHLHANDRQGLERLCRYGARGALALERLSRASGRSHRLSDEAPVAERHHAPLLHRTGTFTTCGVPGAPTQAEPHPLPWRLCSGAKLRPFLLPQEGAEKASEAPQAALRQETRKERTARVDWAGLLRRTFVLDVFACGRCGGRLKGVGVREGGGRGAGDSGAPGPAHGRCEAGLGARAPSSRGVLRLKPPQPREPSPAAHLKAARPGPACTPRGCAASPPTWRTARAAPSTAPLGPSGPVHHLSTGLQSFLCLTRRSPRRDDVVGAPQARGPSLNAPPRGRAPLPSSPRACLAAALPVVAGGRLRNKARAAAAPPSVPTPAVLRCRSPRTRS
jgi:hypothetical protein